MEDWIGQPRSCWTVSPAAPAPDCSSIEDLKSGTVLVREYQGERHTVTVTPAGYVWRENSYPSLSAIALAITGTAWNGHRFFGLRVAEGSRTRAGVRASNAAESGAAP
jgi:hypothetical protein